MKKLFEIPTEEKNRILEMHIHATKKNYLNEQSDYPEKDVNGRFEYVAGAKSHSDSSGVESDKIGAKFFGVNKFTRIHTPGGWALVKNESVPKVDFMSGTDSPIKNEEGLNYDYETGRIMYKKSNGIMTPVSDYNSLFQKLEKHIMFGGGTTAANKRYNRLQEVKNFYENPNNSTFLELCNNLNPHSEFHLYGFPGIKEKCGRLVSLSELQTKLSPQEYVIISEKTTN